MSDTNCDIEPLLFELIALQDELAAMTEERDRWHDKAVYRLKLYTDEYEKCFCLKKECAELRRLVEAVRGLKHYVPNIMWDDCQSISKSRFESLLSEIDLVLGAPE
jgi:hypothetical protein